MLTNDGLRQFYDENVAPFYAQMCRERENILAAAKQNASCVFVISVCVFVVVLFFSPIIALAVILIAVMIEMAIKSRAAERSHKIFLELFNDSIAPKLLEASGLQYIKNGFIPYSEYKKSFISFMRPNHYEGSGLIFGYNGKTPFAFSTLTIGSFGDSNVGSFNGILWMADFNKHFNGVTLVVPETLPGFSESCVGSLFQSVSCEGIGSMTRMEDVAFEKKFKVFAMDNVEARYVLTPLMMQKINALQKSRPNGKVIVSFADSKIFVAFPGENTPLLYCGEELTFSFIKKVYKKLLFYYDLVEILDLNTRIWTKK